MIDLNKLEQYKENNRIEAKKALGGLPKSIWETYSAFANTIGGIILMGVEEYKDKSLHTVDLPEPERLLAEFWEAVNDPEKASVNILSAKDARIEVVNGDHILVIEVPRANRFDKPVYIDGNPLHTYRRNGEGDYRCTMEEYQSMVRDAGVRSQDMLILEEMDTGIFNSESVHRYRQQMQFTRPAHVWESLEDEEFLLKMGAIGIGEDGKKHPTACGLLLLGNEYDIVRVFPHYFLDFREEYGVYTRKADRIVSDSGDWSGNVLDFYFLVSEKLQPDLKLPFVMQTGIRINDNSVWMALREALANCIVNADYHGRGGIVVIKGFQTIEFSNPGSFRINISTAKKGGLSDPRNAVIQKMLSMIDICEHAGHGIANMTRIWKSQNWPEPEFVQTTEPDRITLTLTMKPMGIKKPAGNTDGKNRPETKIIRRQMIIDYLTEYIKATNAELSAYLDLNPSRVRDYLRELIRDEIVVSEGNNRNRKYKLKS